MAVTWGTWRYGNAGQASANGMRLGMEVTWSAVNSGSASVTATVDVWTENQYTHSGDTQTLNYSTNLGADTNYTNNSGGSPVQRATKTYTYNYSTWGSSPGTVTFTAELTGHYWDDGTNPTVSISPSIPARPGGPPTVTSATATAGIRQATISWAGSGNPGIYQYNVYRNNDGNQLIYASTGTSTTDTALGNDQSVYYIVYAYNAAGNGYKLTSTVTTPALPTALTGLSANASTFGQIGLSWASSNGDGYTVTYTIARNGTTLATTTSTSYVDSTVTPSTAYTYTVTPSTTVGSNTGSSVGITSLGGIARIYTGTLPHVTALPQIWNGTAWVNGQVRVYDGVGATENDKWKYGS